MARLITWVSNIFKCPTGNCFTINVNIAAWPKGSSFPVSLNCIPTMMITVKVYYKFIRKYFAFYQVLISFLKDLGAKATK